MCVVIGCELSIMSAKCKLWNVTVCYQVERTATPECYKICVVRQRQTSTCWRRFCTMQSCHALYIRHVHLVSHSMCFISLYGVGQKNWTKTQLTLQRLMIEKRVICQKFQNFVKNEMHDLHISAVKYFLPICVNCQYQNCIEFNNNAWVLLNFHLKYSKTHMVSPDEIQHVRSKSEVSAEWML